MPGRTRSPLLRERNQIDNYKIRHGLSCRHAALNAAHATISIHIDVRPNERGAMGNSEHRMPTRLPCRIDRQGLSNRALVLDLVDQALAHLVAIPRQTQERFVQMGMCFD